jgi:hypothetical protein
MAVNLALTIRNSCYIFLFEEEQQSLCFFALHEGKKTGGDGRKQIQKKKTDVTRETLQAHSSLGQVMTYLELYTV